MPGRRHQVVVAGVLACVLAVATAIAVLVVRRHDGIVHAQPLVGTGRYGGGDVTVDDLYNSGERLIAPGSAGTRAEVFELLRNDADHPVTVLSADLGGATFPPATVVLRGAGTPGPDVAYPDTIAPAGFVTVVVSFERPHCQEVAAPSSGGGGASGGYARVDSVRLRLRYRGATLTRTIPLSRPIVYPVGATCVVQAG